MNDDQVPIESPQLEERRALRTLGALALNGILGALLAALPTLVLPALMMSPWHCCGCGATVAAAEARALRARCLELGVTPNELWAHEPGWSR